ncbi:hypothetical protein HaLaN_14056, partial [Haematococcus lacustris]
MALRKPTAPDLNSTSGSIASPQLSSSKLRGGVMDATPDAKGGTWTDGQLGKSPPETFQNGKLSVPILSARKSVEAMTSLKQ